MSEIETSDCYVHFHYKSLLSTFFACQTFTFEKNIYSITFGADFVILSTAKQIAATWLHVSDKPAMHVQCAQIISPSDFAKNQTCRGDSFIRCECFTLR